MQTPLVMTIIGPDRTGLVESVARVVAEHGGNWLESRMSRLGGEFAGILRIELPADKRQPLLDALQKLQGAGLTVVVRPDDPKTPAALGRQTRLEIVGHDRPGIVREITHALAQAGVNVEEFSSQLLSAPMSGEILFKASADLRLPEGCDLAALKTELEKIAADLLVDVSLVELQHKG
ncbi:MAG TPA: ACT domain-containing protein [Candidatus Acidoferrales bacterium]|nr:ACT domain-containing protein [Candidatus Acidoferrales bacterium]